MFNEKQSVQATYLRLVVGWIFWECVLANMLVQSVVLLPALIPVSGSVFFMCLLGYFVPRKYSLLLAALVVVAFKYFFNPLLPFYACAGVLAQALFGQLVFNRTKYYRLSCVMLSTFAFTAGSIQHMIFHLLRSQGAGSPITGLGLVTGSLRPNNLTLFAIFVAYFLIHIAIGLLIGIGSANLIRFIRRVENGKISFTLPEMQGYNPPQNAPLIMRYAKPVLFIGLFINWMLLYRVSPVSLNSSLLISLRLLFCAFLWIACICPVLEGQAVAYIKKHRKDPFYLKLFIEFLPHTVTLISRSWYASARMQRGSRVQVFLQALALASLSTKRRAASGNSPN